MSEWLLLFLCVFAINLLPAFGPPTWAVLVFFHLNSDLAAVPLVLHRRARGGIGALRARHGSPPLALAPLGAPS